MTDENYNPSPLIFEGMTSIRAVILSKRRKIERLLVDENRSAQREKELSWLRHRADDNGFPIETVTAAELDALTSGTTHGGLAAVCGERILPSLAEVSLPDGGFFVMPEGIEDPYNFAYALRSVYASGADGVVVDPRNWMSAAGTVARSSAGASEYLDIYESPSCADASAVFKRAGYRVVCADMKDSVSVTEADLSRPLLLIIGGEKRGLSRAVLDTADEIVRLDYGRDTNAALSAASAATILAYQVFLYNRK